MKATIKNFLKNESAGGIVLMLAAVLAMLAANSPAAGLYALSIDTPVEIRVGALQIAKPMFLWVNDGLMAIFYSAELSLTALLFALFCLAILAAFIPMRDTKDPSRSPLRELEHDLHQVVAFGVLPLFAFVNAGISLSGVGFGDLLHKVSLGIASGLFIGKQLGVFLFCLVGIRLGLARLPQGVTPGSLYGVAILCGVGFAMSLFVGSLAFENTRLDPEMVFDERLGIIVGSLLSGLLGYLVLHLTLPRSSK